MKKYFFYFLFLLVSQNISAQNIEKINFILNQIFNEEVDSVKIALNDTLKTVLEVLLDEESFYADFKNVKYIGKITSKDNLVNIYSWNIPLKDAMFFNCIIQQKNGKFDFLSQKNCYKPSQNQTIYPNNWYGALYYQIVPFNQKNKTYYMLAGVGQYQYATKIKILEVLDFQFDKPSFGHPVFFKDEKITLSRIVFEYDANSSMFLEYNEKKKRFEFDHLSPMRVKNEEVISVGSDMSIDGYKQIGDYWKLVPDLDVKNNRTKKVKIKY